MNGKSDQLQLKNYNRRFVLNYIRKNGAVTKTGLSEASGLTFMAIKNILEELEELRLIRNDTAESTGLGRKALSYAINERYSHVIGIHVNKHVTIVAMLDLGGNILNARHLDMHQDFLNQSNFVTALVECVEGVIEDTGTGKDTVLGIGIGVPGPVDINKGILLTPPNLPILSYLPIKDILESRIGRPVYVQKDTNAIALGEYWHGGMRNVDDFFYIDVDMGIGSGMIMDGKMNTGANNIAGEFGHATLDINGPLCACGNRGCLETYSSGIAILRDMRRQLEKTPEHPLYAKRGALEIEDVFEMAAQRDLLTISILNQAALYMGVAVGNLINIFDPQMIVMGGILLRNYPQYFDIVQDVANTKKMKGTKAANMSLSRLGENAGVIGAGEIVIDLFFNEQVNDVFAKNI